jgi:hypothetical protein
MKRTKVEGKISTSCREKHGKTDISKALSLRGG